MIGEMCDMKKNNRKCTTLHFGDLSLPIKSNSKLRVIKNEDEDKKVIIYDILDSDYDVFICRVQCSVKYVIVFFADSKENGFLYNKKTREKEFFELSSWNIDENIDIDETDPGEYQVSFDLSNFKIGKYLHNDKIFEFKYDESGEILEEIDYCYEDKRDILAVLSGEDISSKDIPLICINNIIMHQREGVVYEKISG